MNTFVPYPDPVASARVLDRQRLGKQRIEAIQILKILTGLTEKRAWATHPAVRMWAGYEAFLHRRFLRAVLDEWARRGYRNDACEAYYAQIGERLRGRRAIAPPWWGGPIHASHRSNLLRKLPGHYRRYWPAERDDLPYVWPAPAR